MEPIDLLVAASNLSKMRRHVLKLVVNGKAAELEMYATPITLAERKAAQETARSDEQLDINLQLLVAKAKKASGEPMFSPAHLPLLRRSVTAELVAELVNNLYATPTDDGDGGPIDNSPKPSSASSGKSPT